MRNPKLTAVFGAPVDSGAVLQINSCLSDERAVYGSLMADHHLGYSMPIGGVVAYEGAISPSGVGFDIACGNKAVRTTITLDDVVGRALGRLPQGAAGETPPETATDISQGREVTPEGEHKNEAPTRAYSAGPPESVVQIMREVQRVVSFGIGRTSGANVDHELFDDQLWQEVDRLCPGLKDKARQQLGTVGSGNHYVDLLVDEHGYVWVATHFGSRGFGHTIASGFLSLAAGGNFMDRVPEAEAPTVLDLGTEIGDLYLSLMELAGAYAYAGRDYVIEQVLGVLQRPAITMEVHCHHNFAWKENGLMVVRKGATPLTSEPAFIGGSMGDVSVIMRGTGDDIGALGSAPHGAGRVMSRTKAAGKWKRTTVTRTAPDGATYQKKIRVRDASTAAVDWPARHAELAARGIAVLGSGADEAPEVYKDLRTVISHHRNIEVMHTLTPFGVVMAGDDTYDPYKD